MADTTAIHFEQDEMEDLENKIEEATGFQPPRKSIGQRAIQALREKLDRKHEVDFL